MVPAFHVIGPFDASGGSLDSPFPPDGGVILDGTYPGKGMEVSWRPYRAHAGSVGLVEIFGHPDNLKDCVTYAACSVTSSRRIRTQIRFGSDDDALVHLNRREAWRFDGYRGVHFDSDIVPITLERGENEILIKIFNREGPWGFFLRITDADGRPLRGLLFSPRI